MALPPVSRFEGYSPVSRIISLWSCIICVGTRSCTTAIHIQHLFETRATGIPGNSGDDFGRMPIVFIHYFERLTLSAQKAILSCGPL